MASRKKHRQWVMRERAAADAMLSTATSSTMAACELDDKCGSHWCHCPAPGGKGEPYSPPFTPIPSLHPTAPLAVHPSDTLAPPMGLALLAP